MKKFSSLSLFLFLWVGVHSQTCPSSGTTTVSTNPNTYYPGTQTTVNIGATSITLGAASSGTTGISIGDIVLIIQMQGAEINSTNTSSYGDGVAAGNGNGYLNNANHLAGNMEFAVAASNVPLAGGTLTLAAGTFKAYSNSNFGTFGQYRYQVIRVPVYFNATLSANITAPAWSGTTGGVVVMEAKGTFNFAGFTIDASGKGFRGGGGRQLGGGTGTNTDYLTLSTNNANGSKGEGTAGTPRYVNNAGTLLDNGAANEGYPGGSYGRGAPGNAGGGGNDGVPASNSENSGGAGGGNGGAGGRGGNAWNSGAVVGGEPGATFAQNSRARVVMGGGGGAGNTNDGTGGAASGFSSSGAAGGGIVILITKAVGTAGTINVNGANADNTVLNDGSGGGGAGGSVILLTESGAANVTVNAKGGTGGTNTGGGSPHGPGGGGGGVIYAEGTLNAASSVSGGAAGTTSGASNFGAAAGSTGVLVQNASPFGSIPNLNACLVLPTRLISFTYGAQGQGLLLQWKVTSELNVKEYILEKSFDGRIFNTAGTVVSQNSAAAVNTYGYTDNAVNNAVIFYRLKVVDMDGKFVYSDVIVYKASYASDDVFAIYPNPVVNNRATVIIPQHLVNKTVTVRVINAQGKLISTKQQSSYTNTLNIDFPAATARGIVMVQLAAGGEVLYKEKVILQ